MSRGRCVICSPGVSSCRIAEDGNGKGDLLPYSLAVQVSLDMLSKSGAPRPPARSRPRKEEGCLDAACRVLALFNSLSSHRTWPCLELERPGIRSETGQIGNCVVFRLPGVLSYGSLREMFAIALERASLRQHDAITGSRADLWA
jgi:hypothetical protein